MTGPALRKLDSHAAIHEAALLEAIELTAIMEKLLKENDQDRALETAYITVEHWETRTLAHADAEEKGLYIEMAKKSPELKEAVIALTRDHDIMREFVQDIKEILAAKRMSQAVIQRFHALILVDVLHNETEERLLEH